MATTENYYRRLLDVLAFCKILLATCEKARVTGDTVEEGFGRIFLLWSVFHACLEIIFILCRC